MASIAGALQMLGSNAQSLLANSQSVAAPLATSSSSSSSSSAANASATTVSANDFLTLLVTEMKNQDPTASNDPNEYINQLVNVNSLEQLVSINSTLTSAFPTTSTASSGGTGGASTQATGTSQSTNSAAVQAAIAGANAAASSSSARSIADASLNALRAQQGNLSAPVANPAAQRVARALSGESPSMLTLGGVPMN